jgi:GTP-binding protein
VKIKSAEFEISAPDLRQCPRWALPEFAFIGRSNVGKSSLINLLAERRDLAKVSDKPGKTQLINFFVVNGNWSLVDLPGYGYSNVGKQRTLEFNDAVAGFLTGRRNLRRTFVLIDSRLEAQAIDIEFLQWMEAESVEYSLIFTKIDKQSASKGVSNIEAYKGAMAGWRTDLPEIYVSSSKTRDGRKDILGCIERILARRDRIDTPLPPGGPAAG